MHSRKIFNTNFAKRSSASEFCRIDQQKADWFESDFGVNCVWNVVTLLTVEFYFTRKCANLTVFVSQLILWAICMIGNFAQSWKISLPNFWLLLIFMSLHDWEFYRNFPKRFPKTDIAMDSGWLFRFAALTNRKLTGLKVTSDIATLLKQSFILLQNFNNLTHLSKLS